MKHLMLVGMASLTVKLAHTSVWIPQDTTESRKLRQNVHTNQILGHTHLVMAPLTLLCLERSTHL